MHFICSCCSFCPPEVSGCQFIQRCLQQPVPHTWSVLVSPHTHTHTSRTEAAVIVVTCSKEQIHWWEPRVSSSHPDLAEGHRGLFWRPPQEDGEGEQAAPGGGG